MPVNELHKDQISATNAEQKSYQRLETGRLTDHMMYQRLETGRLTNDMMYQRLKLNSFYLSLRGFYYSARFIIIISKTCPAILV